MVKMRIVDNYIFFSTLLTAILVLNIAVFAVEPPADYLAELEAGEYDGLIQVTLSQYDFPPDVIVRTRAELPELQMQYGIEDTVLMLLYIDEDGSVLEALPAGGKRKCHPAFETAAVNAAKKYKFNPATLDDEDVGIWYPIEIIFYIE